MSRTKLVCTIGPASQDRVGELVAAGMDVARLNFSHGTIDGHRAVAERVRAAADAAGRPVAVIADLPGPKVRLAGLDAGERELHTGESVAFVGGDAASDRELATTHHRLAEDLRRGDRVMLADGAVELRVTEAVGGRVACEVVRGGMVRSGAGVNLPSERLSLPAVTERDREALAAIGEMEIDFVAQSFVRRAEDVVELRSLMGGRPLPIMVKLETRAAVDRLDAILEVADALMLARGDLGVELPYADVPIVQKRVIRACLEAGLPSVVATQMLESMTSAPRPTRAEASDAANAVLDGADAVMLSAETAIGRHPVLAAEAAVAIAEAAEAEAVEVEAARRRDDDSPRAAAEPEAAAVARAAVTISRRMPPPGVAAIACFTRSGLTARLLASLRPAAPIRALTPDPAVARRLALWRGVVPSVCVVPESTDDLIGLLNRALVETGLEPGRLVVVVASIPFGRARTNFLKLHRLSEA